MSNVIQMSDPLTIELYGSEYPLATTLRVAYKMQGQHNHKPYSEIFKEMGDMCLEDQIGILYCAFEVANPTCIKDVTKQKFLDWCLDHYKFKEIMGKLSRIIREILGEDDEDEDGAPATSTETEGN